MQQALWIKKVVYGTVYLIPLPPDRDVVPFVEAGWGVVSKAGLENLRRMYGRLVILEQSRLPLALSPAWVPTAA